MVSLFELEERIIFIESLRSNHRNDNAAEKLSGHTDERVCLGENAGLVFHFAESAFERGRKNELFIIMHRGRKSVLNDGGRKIAEQVDQNRIISAERLLQITSGNPKPNQDLDLLLERPAFQGILLQQNGVFLEFVITLQLVDQNALRLQLQPHHLRLLVQLGLFLQPLGSLAGGLLHDGLDAILERLSPLLLDLLLVALQLVPLVHRGLVLVLLPRTHVEVVQLGLRLAELRLESLGGGGDGLVLLGAQLGFDAAAQLGGVLGELAVREDREEDGEVELGALLLQELGEAQAFLDGGLLELGLERVDLGAELVEMRGVGLRLQLRGQRVEARRHGLLDHRDDRLVHTDRGVAGVAGVAGSSGLSGLSGFNGFGGLRRDRGFH